MKESFTVFRYKLQLHFTDLTGRTAGRDTWQFATCILPYER